MCDSYDAAEENELSFKEGDRIVAIEAPSDDWWSGRDAHGNVGLFPGERSYYFDVEKSYVLTRFNS